MALLDDVAPLDQRLEKVDLEPRRGRDVLALFGFVALCLVVAGVYGVMAGESLRRTREMGIRLAIGATPASVFGIILMQALKLAAVALLIAIPLGLASGHLEPRMLIYAGLAIASAIAFAAVWPAWRAARISPSTALRTE
jgi:ABC-type antimicrobial peptide transport system permease subunit